MSQVITLADLKAYVPSDTAIDDDRGQMVVNAVNQWVENHTNRVWGEQIAVTERYDWNGTGLFLRHMDVDTTSVVIKTGWPGQPQQTLTSSAYFCNTVGRITWLTYLSLGRNHNSSYFNDWLEITYKYGKVAVPRDLKLAALGIAAGYYNWAINGGRDVAAVSVGSYSVQYTNKRQSGSGQPDQATSTGDANWAVIESYRQRRM